MTFEFKSQSFTRLAGQHVLLVVDPVRRHLVGPDALPHAQSAGIVKNCRAALLYARIMNIPVAFMRDLGASKGRSEEAGLDKWLVGFEPKRNDSIFDRVGPSCYGSAYLDEVIEGAGRHIVLAGFLGRGGCLATAADALSIGHGVTFLTDAIHDSLSGRFFDSSMASSIKAFTRFDVRVMHTRGWATMNYEPASDALGQQFAC